MSLRPVYVVGHDDLVTKLFREHPNYYTVTDVQKAHLVVFTGGEDVTPFLYGEYPLQKQDGGLLVHCNPSRDMWETKIFKSLPYSVGKVGICRGAQFLNVMSGGSLWQDVDGHCGAHMMTMEGGKYISVTSTHHQMMRPGPDAAILNEAYKSTVRYAMNVVVDNVSFPDPEVVHYWTTNSLCFQPHPEYADASKELTEYFFQAITDNLILPETEEEKKEREEKAKAKKGKK